MAPEAEVRSWLDGCGTDTPLAHSRGLAYGDGAFRTILKYNNKIIYEDEQLYKLLEDCRALEQRPERTALRAGLHTAAAALGPAGTLKLIAMRRSSGRGYASETDEASVLCQCGPLPLHATRCWTAGVAAFFSDLQLSAQPRLAGIKHLNRLEQVLASRRWPRGLDEGILCDMQNRPVCGTRSNLFWVGDGVLYTPELSSCGVAGLTRKRILMLAGDLRIAVEIGAYDRDALLQADEAFLSNSLIGIWPLASLAGRRWPVPGPFTRRLLAALAHPWSGTDD